MAKIKPTKEMKAGRLARKAAAVIAKKGWNKEGARDMKGQLCVRAAIAVAYSGEEAWSEWNQHKGTIGDTCTVFARWLCDDQTAISASANWWNDGHYEDGKMPNQPQPKFPRPASAEEMVAILNKFADEVDPQK